METTKSRGKYWLYFLISIGALIFMSFWAAQFFWIVLPFNCTFFAKGMDLI